MIRILQAKETKKEDILTRKEFDSGVEQAVKDIVAKVKLEGDTAVQAYTEQFDGAKLSSLELSEMEIDMGFRQADEQLVEILYMAAERIAKFHKKQKRNGYMMNEEKGVITGQKVIPLERVGLYVPGGTASYPSSVLMNCIPAKLAGVKEIIMVTPPNKAGKIAPNILAAARIAGVDRVFPVGGAQAVAALAYGTASIPKVDKIVGPGNQYVAEAKKQVYGMVDIDMIAGPSEILIIADETGNPSHIAADLLSQAEHDKEATAVLITDSEAMAQSVQAQLEEQIPKLLRKEIARHSIDTYGKIILVDTLEEAIQISNDIAPEHLELCVDNPFDILDGVVNAGSVFMGKYTPEALGDYFAGPNHTLPTNGTARFSSPLSVDDFVKTMQYTYFTKDALKKVGKTVSYFAKKEGLFAHAGSVEIRLEEDTK